MGFATNDDAAVYRIDADTAIVSTADIITPPVDDPFVFGQIGAANALSDIYAMGGRPLFALNLVGFPSGKLGPEVLEGIVAGALDRLTLAGASLAGGHTTDDEEPKFGMAVTGVVHPERYWSNAGARPGDALILTKPLGSGVLFNANLKKWVSADALQACIDQLITLNRTAAEILARFDVHAATDVTGFGLAGHAYEMAKGAGATLDLSMDALPVFDEALAMYRKGMTTMVNVSNRALIEGKTRFEIDLPDWHREILVDPQTSGGLLAAVPEGQAEAVVAALRDGGVRHAVRIGTVRDAEEGVRLVVGA